MSVEIELDPASGEIENTVTAANITVTGATSNTLTGYDPDEYPASPEYLMYLQCALSGQTTMQSYRFAVNSEGEFTWPSVIFPAAGTWTVTARLDADDSQLASASVVVS